MQTEATRRRVTVPAGIVEYSELGPVDGPVVVLVHGLLVDETLWGEVPALLAERGCRVVAPTWPLASHRLAMNPGADLSPRGVARIVLDLLAELDLDQVTLVGNDTGGAICQFVLDTDPSRVARLVLTNCDAFEVFPPAPFGLLVKAARSTTLMRGLVQTMRSSRLRSGPLGYGLLARTPLTAAQTGRWITPYLTDDGVRRDVAAFARAVRPRELAEVSARLTAYAQPVLLCWAPEDRFFTISLGRRLAEVFPDARLVEIEGAGTFVPLDQPHRLADEIGRFVEGRSA